MVDMILKVLTLNCWGIPVGSSHRAERMDAIADELAKEEYDLVCLQEVWLQSDYRRIRERTSKQLPFSHYFYSGVLGSGVCILSKFPIDDVFFHQWPVNGYIHKIHHGDWFGGKGVGLCQVSINGLRVNVYTTHLHAEYNRESDEYMVHRVLQAFDLSQTVRLTSVGADVVILAGDLNTEPDDLAQRIICHNSELHDAYVFARQSESAQGSVTEDQEERETDTSQNHKELLTSSVARNQDCTTSQRKNSISLWAGFQQDLSRRIDYILFRSGPEVQVTVESYRQPLPQKVPGQNFSYSDHEAVLATLRITKGFAQNKAPPPPDTAARASSLQEALALCDRALVDLRRSRVRYWFLACSLLLALLATLGLEAPGAYHRAHNAGRVLATLVLGFAAGMAGVWHSVEENGILAGRHGMERVLDRLRRD
ncbi:putative neutral sphingomyelinase [Bacillus rossius redtenbacheri]|uniref:putative neutral sphingomyelinase n=1 Tax=Bacillus rossius redtenbacheri TaxID=93214 RepID=UPI002FDD0F36